MSDPTGQLIPLTRRQLMREVVKLPKYRSLMEAIMDDPHDVTLGVVSRVDWTSGVADVNVVLLVGGRATVFQVQMLIWSDPEEDEETTTAWPLMLPA